MTKRQEDANGEGEKRGEKHTHSQQVPNNTFVLFFHVRKEFWLTILIPLHALR